jgi:hypothetical protein
VVEQPLEEGPLVRSEAKEYGVWPSIKSISCLQGGLSWDIKPKSCED